MDEGVRTWKDYKPHERVLWDNVCKKNFVRTHKVQTEFKRFYPPTRLGITKSRAYGLVYIDHRFQRQTLSLAHSGVLIAWALCMSGLIRILLLLIPELFYVSPDHHLEGVDIFGLALQIFFQLALMLFGVIGIVSYSLNQHIDALNKLGENRDTDKTQQKRDKFLKKGFIPKNRLLTDIRSNGPRYLLLGIMVFIVNDIIDIGGEWIGIIIVDFGNPNWPDDPPDQIRRAEIGWGLIVKSCFLLIGITSIFVIVAGILLSWWEVIRVGFVSWDEVAYGGYYSTEKMKISVNMNKIMFTTGFEQLSVWDLDLWQREKRYELQRNLKCRDKNQESDNEVESIIKMSTRASRKSKGGVYIQSNFNDYDLLEINEHLINYDVAICTSSKIRLERRPAYCVCKRDRSLPLKFLTVEKHWQSHHEYLLSRRGAYLTCELDRKEK